MGDSRRRLREFPVEVRSEIGQALCQAEAGESHPSAKPMKGLNAVEIVSDHRGDAYRGIYTTQFHGNLYVLHCFQKKSKRGIEPPKRDLEMIRRRLVEARAHFKGLSRGRE